MIKRIISLTIYGMLVRWFYYGRPPQGKLEHFVINTFKFCVAFVIVMIGIAIFGAFIGGPSA